MKNKRRRMEDVNPNLLFCGKKLKDMNYSVAELAAILDVKPRYIRDYLVNRKGAPIQPRDNIREKAFINGKELYEWAVRFHQKNLDRKTNNALQENEFLCCHCHKHVVPDHFTVEITGPGIPCRKAVCPLCGSQINRYMKKKVDNDNIKK